MAFRNATIHKADVDAGFRVLQKTEVVQGPIGLSQLQLDVRAREDFTIFLALEYEGGALKGRRNRDSRRRCWNKIRHRERNDAHDTEDCGQSFEYAPTTQSQHGFPPPACVYSTDFRSALFTSLEGRAFCSSQRVLIIVLEQIIPAETAQWLLHFVVLFALTNDRITMLFAAMQLVAFGTKRTFQPHPRTCDFGAKADIG